MKPEKPRRKYRQTTLLVIAVAAFTIIKGSLSQLPSESLAILNGLGTLAIGLLFLEGLEKLGKVADSSEFGSSRHQQNRRNLIGTVRRMYVDNVLEKPLHRKVQLLLGLEELEGESIRPSFFIEGDSVGQTTHSMVDIVSVIDQFGRVIVVLGEPGSGKTFLLWELCSQLLNRAEHNNSNPLPVVLNLCNWVQGQKDIREWVTDELDRQYGLNWQVSENWLEADQLCILLDGLDEVREEFQGRCIDAIEEFLVSYKAPVIISGSANNHRHLRQKLSVSCMLMIQPLFSNQINQFLSYSSPRLEVFHELRRDSSAAQTLLQTPLSLNIIAVACNHADSQKLLELGSRKALKLSDFYSMYIQRVFELKSPSKKGYTVNQALRWLRNLANIMSMRSDAQLFVEDLDLSWLPPNKQRKVRFQSQVWLSILSGIPLGLLIGIIIGSLGNAVGGMISGILFAVALSLDSHKFIRQGMSFFLPVDDMKIGDSIDWHSLARVDPWVLFVPLMCTTTVGVWTSLGGFTWVEALIFGLICGLCLLGDEILKAIEPAESKSRIHPNQDIRRTVLNIITYGIVLGFLFGFWWTILNAPILALEFDSFSVGWLLLGVTVGVVYGCRIGGGEALVRYVVLRKVIDDHDLLPFDLISFLDEMESRLLIQRTGASYCFTHHSLHEYIGNLTDEEINQVVDLITELA